MQPYHLIYQSQWMRQPSTPCSSSPAPTTRSTTSPGCCCPRPKAAFCKCWKTCAPPCGTSTTTPSYPNMRHYQCQVLGEGSRPECSFATWTMGFRQAQSHDLRTLLGEAAPDDLGLILRPYPRPQLLGLVLDFMKNRRIPSWQEQKPTPTEQRCNGLDVHHPSVGRKSMRPDKQSRNLC